MRTILSVSLAALLLNSTVVSNAHAQLTDIGTMVGPQCHSLGANNNGTIAGVCSETDSTVGAFIATPPGNAVQLQALVRGQNCTVSKIENSGLVIGSCGDANSISQAVYWSPSISYTVEQLQPVSGDVSASPSAANQDGAIVGSTISGSGVVRPALWPAGSLTPTLLPIGLLNLTISNCNTTGVQDGIANRPNIIGNCPDGSGHSIALAWTPTGLLGVYVATNLTKPAYAVSCVATEINTNGRILGNCDFGTSVGSKTVVWPSITSAPVTLVVTENGTNYNLHNEGVDMNSAGLVVGQFKYSNGYVVPYYWDSTSTAAGAFVAINPLSGGYRASSAAIGNNGNVIGTSEITSGNDHGYVWTLSGGTVDAGVLPNGNNSALSALSVNGCVAGGRSEVANHASHATLLNLCGSSTATSQEAAKNTAKSGTDPQHPGAHGIGIQSKT